MHTFTIYDVATLTPSCNLSPKNMKRAVIIYCHVECHISRPAAGVRHKSLTGNQSNAVMWKDNETITF